MLSLLDLIIYGVGLVILAAWLFFFFKGLKYAELFDSLEENDYPFKEIYFLGYAVVETFGYQYKSKQDRKARKELSILYGDKYAEYFLRVVYAQKITVAFTLLALAVPVYGFANDITASLVVLLFASNIYQMSHH